MGSSQFPTSLDTLPDGMTASTPTTGGATDHAAVHAQLADAVMAAEQKAGITGSTDTSSLDHASVWHFVTVTGAYTAHAGDWVLVDASAGPVTVSGATPSRAGQVIRVEKVDTSANAVTFTPISGTVDGAASAAIPSDNQSMDFGWDAANWHVG